MKRQLLIAALAIPLAAQAQVINEIRIQQTGTDTDEYFELAGSPGASLDGLTYIVIGDGTATTLSGVVEVAVSLDGQALAGDGYFLVAEPTFSLGTADLTTAASGLNFEDGDNVTHVLVMGFTGSTGDDLDTDDDGVLDSMPWTSVVSAVSLVDDPDGGERYYAQALGGEEVGPDGADPPPHVYRNETTRTYQLGAENSFVEDTPGAANPSAPTQSAFDVQSAYRMLAVNVVSMTWGDLAEVNIVQGMNGQYATADPNVFHRYEGGDVYGSPTTTATSVPPGKGFFYYLYDFDRDPDNSVEGGGTSRFFALDGFTYSIAGTVPTTDVVVTTSAFMSNQDADDRGYYMIGNPYDVPFDAGGISQTGGNGTMSTTFQAWDPSGGTYEPIDGGAGDNFAVYQGAFVMIDYTGVAATDPEFTFAYASRDPGGPATFYGRQDHYALALDLDAAFADGGTARDGLADLWFREDGALGRDRIDSGEISPPTADKAQIAIADGLRQLAVSGMPLDLRGTIEVPVVFRTSRSGTFTLTLGADTRLPADWGATLADAETGDTHDLSVGLAHTFMAPAGDWTPRFVLTLTTTPVASRPGAEAAVRVGEVYPNPTLTEARVSVEVDQAQRVAVTVFDAVGRRVAVVEATEFVTGEARVVTLPTAGLAAGVYVVRVEGTTVVESRRLVVTR